VSSAVWNTAGTKLASAGNADGTARISTLLTVNGLSRHFLETWPWLDLALTHDELILHNVPEGLQEILPILTNE
jgi:hypothetical protein